MENFLVSIEQDATTGIYVASFLNGDDYILEASTYQDAVLEADLIEPPQYA